MEPFSPERKNLFPLKRSLSTAVVLFTPNRHSSLPLLPEGTTGTGTSLNCMRKESGISWFLPCPISQNPLPGNENEPENTSFLANFILVDNTLDALQKLGAAHRSRFSIPVIGITGSNGKTIVKEWLFQLMNRDKKIVQKSEKLQFPDRRSAFSLEDGSGK